LDWNSRSVFSSPAVMTFFVMVCLKMASEFSWAIWTRLLRKDSPNWGIIAGTLLNIPCWEDGPGVPSPWAGERPVPLLFAMYWFREFS